MIFDTLSNLELYIPTVPQLRVVADAMDHDNVYDLNMGNYATPDSNVKYSVCEYKTSAADKPFEFHKNKTIVQIVLSGSELVSTTWRELAANSDVYDKKSDTGFFTAEPISVFQMVQGRFLVFFPGEPYKTSVSAADSEKVKKVVFTLE